MDFLDIIKELRKGTPDIEKACKAMKILGWICVVAAVWNCAIYYLAPFDEGPLKLPANYPYLALISLLSLGGLFLYSSQEIKRMNPSGKKAGQLAIFLSVGLIIGFMFFMFSTEAFIFEGEEFSVFFILFLTVFFAQFAVPAYYGVRYLGRLPIQQSMFERSRINPENITTISNNERTIDNSKLQPTYKEALFPFGIFGTFASLIAVPLIFFLVIEKFGASEQMAFMFMPIFFFIFLTPVVYNLIPSTFQKNRNVLVSYTGGGSIFLFSGTWPFFRLIIYSDGLEVRVMFHRFFIPYDKMDDIPEKIGFFSRGLLIKSNLQGVPSGIRYQGFGMKRVVQIVNQNRNKFNNNA